MSRSTILCAVAVVSFSACSLLRQSYAVGTEARLTGRPELKSIADRLQWGTLSPVMLDANSLAEYKKFHAANDARGFSELFITDRMIVVPENTKVLVIEVQQSTSYRVRILEGVFEGRAGWVDVEWMKRARE